MAASCPCSIGLAVIFHPGCKLCLSPRAPTNYSHTSLKQGWAPFKFLFSFTRSTSTMAEQEDFGQKTDQQPAQQAARQNSHRSAAPSSDGTQGKARSMAAPGSLLSAQFRSCVCRGSVGPGVTSVPTTRAVSNSLHLKALECL